MRMVPVKSLADVSSDVSGKSSFRSIDFAERAVLPLPRAIDQWATIRFWVEHRVAEINAAARIEVLGLADSLGPQLGFEIAAGDAWFRLEITHSGSSASLTSSSSWSSRVTGEPSSNEAFQDVFAALLEEANFPGDHADVLNSEITVPKMSTSMNKFA